MAIRFDAPIYTNEEVLKSVGIDTKMDPSEEKSGQREIIKLSVERIQLAIEDAVKREDYETAALLRDLLNKKQSDS
jgi:protein-arginine kinase activator protein McsA